MKKTLGAKRTLRGLFLGIAALALGLLAQQAFFPIGSVHGSATPIDGLLIYVVVVLLFGIAVHRAPVCVGPRWYPNWGAAKIDVHRGLQAVILLLLSGTAVILSLSMFTRGIQNDQKWWFYLAAIGLFVAAVYVLALPSPVGLGGRFLNGVSSVFPQKADYDAPLTRNEWIVLLVVLLVGLFFRLHRFPDLPYGLWYDEADNGLWARRILAEPGFRPVFSTTLPAHYIYLMALSFRLFGDSVGAIRVVSVLFGMLAIVAAYWCGREFFGGIKGRRLGLILAFLMAVFRWDVTWSRVGLHGVAVPFFELWIVAALLRGLRTGSLPAFAWAGIGLGLGLSFYTPMWAFPLVLGAFVLAWLIQPGKTRRLRGLLGRSSAKGEGSGLQEGAPWVRYALPALLFALGALLAVGPLAQFAIRHPDVYLDRARHVSLLADPSASGRPLALLVESTVKHLLMFNYRGDPNGRHNLPGAPMLDRFSGVLFVLGVVTCIMRWRDSWSVPLLLWLLVPLSAGILSVGFEAPQSLRSIGSLPAAAILICLPMDWFATEWNRVFANGAPHPTRLSLRGPLAAIGLVVLLAIGLENGVTYFYYWARDFASWAAYNAAETRLAQDVALYRDDYDLRFDPLLTAHLTTRFLTPDYGVYHHFDPATVFPIRGAGRRGGLLFVSPETRALHEQVQTFYPEARVETFAHPYSGNVVLYKYFFPLQTIADRQGLDARYVSLASAREEPYVRVDPVVDFDWQDGPPTHYPFVATWTGGLLAPDYGAYVVQVDAPGEFVLRLDERPVMSGTGSQEAYIVMAQGVHALYLECRIDGPGAVRLAWDPPGESLVGTVPPDALYRASWPVCGLLGRFYGNDSWSGEPEIVRIDHQVAYYFHFLPTARPYTVAWDGRLAVPVSGEYRLGVVAVSSASLYVDGQLTIETARDGQLEEAELQLSAGLHDLSVQYIDDQHHSKIYLYWQPPGMDRTLIPADALFPPTEGAWWPVEGATE